MILVEVAGFLGADAEERYTSTGKRVIELRIAARVKQGNKEDTVWWKATIWDDRFDKMVPYLKKGTALILIGEMLIPETYLAKDGTQKVSLSLRAEMIKFSPFGKSDRDKNTTSGNANYGFQNSKQAVQEGEGHDMAYSAFSEGGNEGFTDDNLPF